MSCIAHKCQAQVFHERMIHYKYDVEAQELGEKLWSLDSQWWFEWNHNWPTYIIHQTRVLSTQPSYPCHCHNLAGDTLNTPCRWSHYICLWLALVLPNSSLLPLHFQFPLASWIFSQQKMSVGVSWKLVRYGAKHLYRKELEKAQGKNL